VRAVVTLHTFRIRVRYPAGDGRIVLRTAHDWERDLIADAVSVDRTTHDFVVRAPVPHLYFKPRLGTRGDVRWSQGSNYLALPGPRVVYPFFDADARCAECELHTFEDAHGRRRSARVFYPPGYWENTLRRHPVVYLQDGQNLFFPGEAFGGEHWRVAETLRTLDAMNAVTPVLAVGVYANDREHDYTAPGYDDYARFVAKVVKPWVDRTYRTLDGPRHTATLGSSLGGVAALHLAWSRPETFGMAAALSATFGWRDDLRARIEREPRPPIRIYLDSGWPHDNYEATRDLRALLAARGFRDGFDLHYLAFPHARHHESAWATRLHVPLQLFFGSASSELADDDLEPRTCHLRLETARENLFHGATS
jgi:enterochelin esterase-like enzyme